MALNRRNFLLEDSAWLFAVCRLFADSLIFASMTMLKMSFSNNNISGSQCCIGPDKHSLKQAYAWTRAVGQFIIVSWKSSLIPGWICGPGDNFSRQCFLASLPHFPFIPVSPWWNLGPELGPDLIVVTLAYCWPSPHLLRTPLPKSDEMAELSHISQSECLSFFLFFQYLCPDQH